MFNETSVDYTPDPAVEDVLGATTASLECVFQEPANNALFHGQATQFDVDINTKDRVVSFTDNGISADPQRMTQVFKIAVRSASGSTKPGIEEHGVGLNVIRAVLGPNTIATLIAQVKGGECYQLVYDPVKVRANGWKGPGLTKVESPFESGQGFKVVFSNVSLNISEHDATTIANHLTKVYDMRLRGEFTITFTHNGKATELKPAYLDWSNEDELPFEVSRETGSDQWNGMSYHWESAVAGPGKYNGHCNKRLCGVYFFVDGVLFDHDPLFFSGTKQEEHASDSHIRILIYAHSAQARPNLELCGEKYLSKVKKTARMGLFGGTRHQTGIGKRLSEARGTYKRMQEEELKKIREAAAAAAAAGSKTPQLTIPKVRRQTQKRESVLDILRKLFFNKSSPNGLHHKCSACGKEHKLGEADISIS